MFDVTEIVDSAFEETTETAETDIEVEETTEESTTSPAETETEAKEAEETKPEETTEEQLTTTEPTLTLQFNHESKEVTLAEARILAQKGMYYDTVSEHFEWLKELAKSNGYDNIADYRKAVEDAMTSTKAKEMAQEKKISEDVAKELIEKEAKIQKYEAEKADRDTKADKNQKLAAEIDAFRKAYPDVDIGKLPKEVLTLKAENPDVPLRFLYSTYSEEQLKTEKAVLEKQKQNESSSTPSLKGNSENSSFADDLINEIFKK